MCTSTNGFVLASHFSVVTCCVCDSTTANTPGNHRGVFDGIPKCIEEMLPLIFMFSGVASVFGIASAAKLVPGRAFDRFITIWLENQVRKQYILP
jgi:hypothetical protein